MEHLVIYASRSGLECDTVLCNDCPCGGRGVRAITQEITRSPWTRSARDLPQYQFLQFARQALFLERHFVMEWLVAPPVVGLA